MERQNGKKKNLVKSLYFVLTFECPKARELLDDFITFYFFKIKYTKDVSMYICIYLKNNDSYATAEEFDGQASVCSSCSTIGAPMAGYLKKCHCNALLHFLTTKK